MKKLIVVASMTILSTASVAAQTKTLTVSATQFVAANTADIIRTDGVSRWVESDPAAIKTLFAPVTLPDGARVKAFSLHYCATEPTSEDIVVQLLEHCEQGVECYTEIGDAVSSHSNAPGCFTAAVNTNRLPVENTKKQYFLRMTFSARPSTGNTSPLNFQSVRVYYENSVPPGPATATFEDVPVSHPFYCFVEAMVAGGLTAGCTENKFCPDTAVTRGELAAFLISAVGAAPAE